MMSFVEMSFVEVVKKQYVFKLKAYAGIFLTMIAMQMLAMFFSFLGASNGGGNISNIQYHATIYSADLAIIFIGFWIFISAILMTNKENQSADFTFVTNRLSGHVANALFLMTASILGGVTVQLSDKVVKLIMSSIFAGKQLPYLMLDGGISSLLIGMVGTALYLLLFAMIGYFVGMLVQWFKGFIIILPSLLIAMFVTGDHSVLLSTIEFFGTEPSLFMFSVKVIMTAVLLFVLTMAFSNRLEVRR